MDADVRQTQGPRMGDQLASTPSDWLFTLRELCQSAPCGLRLDEHHAFDPPLRVLASSLIDERDHVILTRPIA